MVFLLTYWKEAIGGILAVLLLGFAVYVTHVMDERVKQDALDVQRAQLVKQCEAAQQTSNEVSHEYQNQLSSLRDELDSAKRVQPHACIPVSSGTSRYHAATPDKGLHQAHAGLDSDDLYDFAGDAEQVGRQLDACQSFIAKTRQSI